MKTIADLRWCLDPTVRAHLGAWFNGNNLSFENMLIALCCDLVKQKQELIVQVLTAPKLSQSIIISKEPHDQARHEGA